MAEQTATEVPKWRSEGKFHNRTRLNVVIMSAQYNEMVRLAEACGLNITQAVAEALAMWINTTRKMGV